MYQQEVQGVPSLRWLETQIWQQQFHQRADAVLGPNIGIQEATNAINEVKHQKRVEIEKKPWKQKKFVSRCSQRDFSSIFKILGGWKK